MRELEYGAELQTLTQLGWTFSGGPGELYVGAGQQHLISGQGGKWALQLGAAAIPATATSPTLPVPLVETLLRVPVKGGAGSAGWEIRLKNGATTIAHLKRNGSDQVEIYVDAILQDTSTETLSDGTWYVISLRYCMLNVGLFEVFLDADLTTPIATFAGDTRPGAPANIDVIELVGEGDTFDDAALHSVTMAYDGGTGGVPSAGETITGAGATAVVSAVVGDATSGRLYLRSLTGAFIDNEPITGSGTFVAVVNAAPASTNTPGLESNSDYPSVYGVMRALVPNDNGTYSEFVGSDGNQVDNYVHVDDWDTTAVIEADFVESGTDGARDSYALQDPGPFTGVNSVNAVAWVKRQGVAVNSMELAVRVDGTDHYGTDTAVGLTYAMQEQRFDLNPDTGEIWTVAELTAAESGFRVNA